MKQSDVTMSSANVGFVTLGTAVQQCTWFWKTVSYTLGGGSEINVVVTVYDEGAIRMSENDENGNWTKLIEISYRMVRDMGVEQKDAISNCSANKMVAEKLTKPLARFLCYDSKTCWDYDDD